jgi:hypothetical protein
MLLGDAEYAATIGPPAPPRLTAARATSVPRHFLEDLMSARAETLAKQFEAKAAEMTSTLESSPTRTGRNDRGEKWTVGSPRTTGQLHEGLPAS